MDTADTIEILDPAETDLTALVAIEGRADAQMIFAGDPEQTLRPILAPVFEAARTFKALPLDVRAEQDRKKIASFAHKISKARAAVERAGKAVADEVKQVPKRVDASRNWADRQLEALRDSVREPLDAWEAAEATRKEKHLGTLDALKTACAPILGTSLANLKAMLAKVQSIEPDSCDEYADEVRMLRFSATSTLEKLIADAERQAREAAELAELRRKEAERNAIDNEADEAAKREAEDKRHQAALKKAAEDAAVAAAKRERERIQQEQEAAAAAAAARERDTAHKRKTNREILEDLVALGLGEESAKAVIKGAAQGKVRHLTINY